ncbi:MAG: efflux RND transporter periplasmic adaptor subunit [Sulfurovum sp.]|nr:efflux RND transporter periplasmic adaptor subunit [Sulfurovum sp.]
MTRFLLLLLPLWAFATQEHFIVTSHAKLKPLGKIIQTNAQITQLSEQKQKIVSRLPGHVEKYFVTTGQEVQKGDKVVLIESIDLSRMSAEYVAMKQQSKAAKEQLSSTKKLYKKGLTSQNELNQKIIEIEEILSKQNALESQLKSLGVKVSSITKATDQFVLYAHGDGIVGEIYIPLHSNVNAEDTLMSLVNQEAYYAIAFISTRDAILVSPNTKAFISVLGTSYEAQFIQLLPSIDEKTQRAKVLFMMKEVPKNMLINAFVEMQISLEPYQNAIMVKKSALTLFQGEWVVFTEAHHEDETHKGEKHDDHDAHDEKDAHDDHDAHDEKDAHDDHDEHDEKDAHDEASPYERKIVEIIAYSGDEVAVQGIHAGEEYVSEGVYFVKSMMLKSSLGEHGH